MPPHNNVLTCQQTLETIMATTEQALDRQLAISPQLLEIISEDPEALAKLHRVQRAMLADRATRQLLAAENPLASHMAAMIEALRKAEKDDMPVREPGAQGVGLTLNIVAPNGQVAFTGDAQRVIEGEVEVDAS